MERILPLYWKLWLRGIEKMTRSLFPSPVSPVTLLYSSIYIQLFMIIRALLKFTCTRKDFVTFWLRHNDKNVTCSSLGGDASVQIF